MGRKGEGKRGRGKGKGEVETPPPSIPAYAPVNSIINQAFQIDQQFFRSPLNSRRNETQLSVFCQVYQVS